jgi:flagellin
MGLRIQNNIAAMNAHRQLSISDAALSKSLQRLSSGYRINNASDDAAGLAISQSFRADIASFKVASRNTSEANSLLQVAEGSLDQMGDILTRLKELATQAASGNAGSNIDKINDEANQLISELDRIATSTNYAGTDLLTGNLAAGTMAGTVADASHGSDATAIGEGGAWFGATATGDLTAITGITGTLDSSIANLEDSANTWTIAKNGTASGLVLSNGNGMQFTATVNTGEDTITIAGMGENQGDLVIAGTVTTTTDANGDTITFDKLGISSVSVDAGTTAQAWTFSTSGSNIVLTGADGTNQSVAATAGSAVDFTNLGISFTLDAEWDANDLDGLTITTAGSAGTSLDFQIGSENATDNQLSISLSDVRASALSLTSGMLSTQAGAQTALTTINSAIDTLSSSRGDVGAYMNRLSYASANLSSMIENVQAAESVIRDVDMAGEMISFTKNQILMQAGTAMLAQANMAPQSILSLFG